MTFRIQDVLLFLYTSHSFRNILLRITIAWPDNETRPGNETRPEDETRLDDEPRDTALK